MEEEGKILEGLAKIVSSANDIDATMNKNEPHKNGSANVALPGSNSIVHFNRRSGFARGEYFFTSFYQDAEGRLYEIQIRKMQ